LRDLNVGELLWLVSHFGGEYRAEEVGRFIVFPTEFTQLALKRHVGFARKLAGRSRARCGRPGIYIWNYYINGI